MRLKQFSYSTQKSLTSLLLRRGIQLYGYFCFILLLYQNILAKSNTKVARACSAHSSIFHGCRKVRETGISFPHWPLYCAGLREENFLVRTGWMWSTRHGRVKSYHHNSHRQGRNKHSHAAACHDARSLASSLLTVKMLPYRHAHRPNWWRQFFIKTLFQDDSRLWQVDI